MPTDNTSKHNDGITNVKAWLTPILMSILGIMIWQDIMEMRDDVKELIKRDSATQIRIFELEKDIQLIQKQLYIGNSRVTLPKSDKDEND
jgi:hypothetical protein